MNILTPDYIFNKITDISIDFFQNNNISCVLLDVDNTLTSHGNPIPYNNVPEWINVLKLNNIKPYIISNNTYKRVAPFAKLLEVDFISNAAKPFGFNVKKIFRNTGISDKNTLLIGDQLFTDILCGKLSGVKTVLVKPIKLETNLFFKFKRKIENIFLKGL